MFDKYKKILSTNKDYLFTYLTGHTDNGVDIATDRFVVVVNNYSKLKDSKEYINYSVNKTPKGTKPLNSVDHFPKPQIFNSIIQEPVYKSVLIKNTTSKQFYNDIIKLNKKFDTTLHSTAKITITNNLNIIIDKFETAGFYSEYKLHDFINLEKNETAHTLDKHSFTEGWDMQNQVAKISFSINYKYFCGVLALINNFNFVITRNQIHFYDADNDIFILISLIR